MSTNKKTAAGGNPTAAKKNTTTKIIAVPLDVVNMSDNLSFPKTCEQKLR